MCGPSVAGRFRLRICTRAASAKRFIEQKPLGGRQRTANLHAALTAGEALCDQCAGYGSTSATGVALVNHLFSPAGRQMTCFLPTTLTRRVKTETPIPAPRYLAEIFIRFSPMEQVAADRLSSRQSCAVKSIYRSRQTPRVHLHGYRRLIFRYHDLFWKASLHFAAGIAHAFLPFSVACHPFCLTFMMG